MIYKAQECCSAFTGILIDTCILQNLSEHGAYLLLQNAFDIFRSKAIATLELVHPISVSCKGFIRTIPLMMYDACRPEDLDSSLEDHIADEWRYLCMSRPVKPLKPVEQVSLMNDPLGRR